ncbi:hypothetical protein [Actinomadura rudentiformis]|uniref:Uncharacterized protein n=1 Tax=Actinomadura rudentiformis TaxID=359158 RepID=A0A6H9YCP6_9ACTN|nr:hypothetical protein [Actinomadura rudentiformis]KAB2341855.1 hypothetical protein F8566_40455 [Actinomadura rudentiformis]
MIALARFQVSGYLRSLRILQPVIVIFLILALLLSQAPANARLAAGAFGDVAAFMFPVWAWTARALLDTQPDEQRALSATAARHHLTPAFAGLLAAYAVNLALGVAVIAVPTAQGLSAGLDAGAVSAGLALNLLVAAAGTFLGAWTSRAIIPDPGVSLLALLGGAAAALLLSIGPLSWLSVPMVDWIRAAHDGPDDLIAAFPGLGLHIALWTAAVGVTYVLIRRTRP